MPEEFVLYELPSEVWAVEFSNLFGDRVVELVGTGHAARRTAEQYADALSCSAHPLTSKRSVPKQRPQVDNAHRGSVAAQ
jgi:hypothetical protein